MATLEFDEKPYFSVPRKSWCLIAHADSELVTCVMPHHCFNVVPGTDITDDDITPRRPEFERTFQTMYDEADDEKPPVLILECS